MLILCRLTVPFALALPDVNIQEINYLGERVSISLERGTGKQVYSFSDDERAAWLDESKGRILYKIPAVFANGKKVVSRVIACRDGIEQFIEGFVDTVLFTTVNVHFEVDGAPLVADDKRLESIKAKGLKIVRYFLNAYRTVAADPDVFIPSKSDSPIVMLYAAEEYQFIHDKVEGKFRQVLRQIGWQSLKENVLLKGELSSKDREHLQTQLDGGRDVPVHILALIDARHQSHAFGEHRLAIVLAVNAFELFVQVAFTEECKARGVTSLPTNSSGVKAPACDEIQRGKIRDDLLGRIGKFLTGTNLLDTPEYNAWFNQSYRPRNEFLHKGRLDATDIQAKEAFEAIISYMNFIESRLKDSREDVAVG